MSRVRSSLALATVLVLGAMLAIAAEAQAAAARRGLGLMRGRTSLVGLLSLEQVQTELKLNEEQTGKVKEIVQKVREEMREPYAALREITDPAKRQAKMAELNTQADQKVRTELRDVLSREQVMRLYQIRIQVGGTLYALSNPRIAQRLNLTDEQKTKAAAIDKATQEKTSALMKEFASLTPEERRERSAELRKIRQKADEEALGLLNAEQKEALTKMKGEPFELRMRRGGA
jgi:Spy/CpxP family protein refolding chaperone